MLKRFDNHRRSNSRSPVCSGWIFVRTGSRDETVEESGVSHFLEHMLFKGTKKRDAAQVNKDFDKIGANYNAFTSEENTVFYASTLPEYHQDATEILADILRPSLRSADFEMEKKSSLKKSECMKTTRAGWFLITHASYFLLITLWATAYSEQPKASSI